VKDLNYLQAFSPKILREARRILSKGFTADDIDEFIGKQMQFKPTRKLPKEVRKQVLSQTNWGKRKP